IDPQDRSRLKQEQPGIVYFWDFDQAVSRLYGVLSETGSERMLLRTGGGVGGAVASGSAADQQAMLSSGADPASTRRMKYEARSFVLDPALRVVAVIPFAQEPAAHLDFALQ